MRPLLVVALLALGSRVGLAQGVPDSGIVIRPGDLVRIAVWGRPDLSGEFTVSPDGAITHPLFREVKVAGIPLATVDERVRTFLLRFETNPAFIVSPLLRVFVGGEVRQPNLYTVPPGTTVAQAIALAGGPTTAAEERHVDVERDDGGFSIDLTKPDPSVVRRQVRSGDRITVARKRSVFQSVVVPAGTVIAAAASLVGIYLQTRRRN